MVAWKVVKMVALKVVKMVGCSVGYSVGYLVASTAVVKVSMMVAWMAECSVLQ